MQNGTWVDSSVMNGMVMEATDFTPLQTDAPVSEQQVQENRKMWQIFTDSEGEVQRKCFPIITEGHSSSGTQNKSPKVPKYAQQSHSQGASGHVHVTVSPIGREIPKANSLDRQIPRTDSDEDLNLFGSLNGLGNPNAIHIQQLANGKVVPDTSSRPQKPPRRVEIFPRGGAQVLGTVVFQNDSTYTKFDNVEVNSEEDEELFGDGTSRPRETCEEQHFIGKKVLIRSESDLDLLLKSPTRRIWLFKSKYCCADFYKWPFLRTYLKVLGVGLGMVVAYVCVVLLVVYIMKKD